MSSPAIQFKGSGWYITDYAEEGHRAARTTEDGKADKDGEGRKGDESESRRKLREGQKDSRDERPRRPPRRPPSTATSTTTPSTSAAEDLEEHVRVQRSRTAAIYRLPAGACRSSDSR